MAVYYRYKSGVDTFSVPVPAPSIPVADLKRLILGTARHGHGRTTRGRGQRESVALYDSTTGEEYTDDRALVPRSSTVLVRRVAGPPADAITFTSSPPPPKAPARDDASSDSAVTSSSPAEDDEDRAISAVIDAAQLKWEDRHRWRRCSNRGAALEGGGGGVGRPAPAPPAGYVCHRCRVPGHLIQHCPTNGDPRYDWQPTRASWNANLPTPSPASSSSPDDVGVPFPPELHCKICNKVMADAVVASRCCFGSFCDACIRAHIAATKPSSSRCVCGGQARADDLIPNLTLRATIAKLLATKAATGAGSGSAASTDNNRKSSAGSNAAEPSSCTENLSHVSATAGSEHSDDGNASSSSSTSKSAAAPAAPVAREPARTKQTTTADSRGIAARTGYGYPEQYGFGGPACYGPLLFGATPWACDPYTYYGMPCGGGGGYMNVPVPGGYHDGWGWQGRKRMADGEYQRHAEGGFKRRCGSRSEVAV